VFWFSLSNARHTLTRTYKTIQDLTSSETLGVILRTLREKRELPLWKVAAAAEMDSALLSKIELGQRLPTPDQTAALAKFFGIASTELESMRIAEKFVNDHGHNPAAAALALTRIQESAGEYLVKTKRATGSKRTKL
jgi:transcriptional regulator with XRE-family HTH domain